MSRIRSEFQSLRVLGIGNTAACVCKSSHRGPPHFSAEMSPRRHIGGTITESFGHMRKIHCSGRSRIAFASATAVLQASPASATVSPSSLDFGDVPFGAPTLPKTVSITAPQGAAFKSIFGYDQFQPVAEAACVPFVSTECTVSVFANNRLDRLAAFGEKSGNLLVTYTSGTTESIAVRANFIPPPLQIVSPQTNANYPFSQSKLNATDTVSYKAQGSASTAIVWSVALNYRTSGARCKTCTSRRPSIALRRRRYRRPTRPWEGKRR